MSQVYKVMKIFFKLIVNTFFRDIQVIGLENIPLNEPMILCGNHSNQFVDGMMLVSLIPREVSFIMAAKSVRRPVIGHLAKMVHVVPVERPQDLAKNGKGKIAAIINSILKGEGTDFVMDLKVGDSVMIQSNKQEFQVKAINNATEAKIFSLEEENPSFENLNSNYKIIPKVDQSEMFDNVFKCLKEKRCIGIFPEGGSHDRSDFLELKAGIAIMALGAMAKHGIRVNIVPIGLNYYKPSAFRSKVLIDIGKAYAIPNELADLYNKNKREAISVLLHEIENRMKDCHIVAPTYSELASIFLVRDIYKPDKENLTPEKEQELNRRFSEGYQKLKEHPEIVGILGKIKKYYADLKVLSIKDSEVLTYTTTFIADLFEIFKCFLMIIISFSFALPGVIMSGPFGLLLQYLSEKERLKALAGSKVKITANDVVASHKIICAFIVFPMQSLIYTTAFYLLIVAFVTSTPKYQALLTIGFFLIWPIYAYFMFRSMDRVARNWKTLKAKGAGILFGSKYASLKKFRLEIQGKIRELVDKHGPDVFEDFEKKRVISKKELYNRRGSWMLEEVFAILEEKRI